MRSTSPALILVYNYRYGKLGENTPEDYDIICLLLSALQLIEAVVLPMTHKDRFEALGIQPPKGENIIMIMLT